MGGGILPATIYNNKVYLLFGKERSIDINPGWSDFGGGSEKGESLLATAIREGSEELTGFLGDPQDIKKLLKKYGTYNIDTRFTDHPMYRVHIFPMEYDDMLVKYYNNNQRFLQKKLDPNIIRSTTIFEKPEIKWFSFEDIKKQKSKFRIFYQKIVKNMLNKQEEIQHFIKQKLNKHTKTQKIKSKNKRKTMKNYKNK